MQYLTETQQNEYADLYLDYVNNFLTVDYFAEYHGIQRGQALSLITYGRDCHELRVQANKARYKKQKFQSK